MISYGMVIDGHHFRQVSENGNGTIIANGLIFPVTL
jgi:hypothetical protein